MFWVHDKFGKGLDDPDGSGWPTTQPNWSDPTSQTRWVDRKTHTGRVDPMIQTSLTAHSCQSCSLSSSTWAGTTWLNSVHLGHWLDLAPLGGQAHSTHLGRWAHLYQWACPTSLCCLVGPNRLDRWVGRARLGHRANWAFLGRWAYLGRWADST